MAGPSSFPIDLSESALLAEINELSQKNLDERDMLLFVGAGYRKPVMPHMEFEYSDPEIHEDLYQLMKYYCGIVCESKDCDKIMAIWTTFLEPLLGVPQLHDRAKGTEEFKDKNQVNECVSGVGEENGRPGEGTSENGKPCGLLTNDHNGKFFSNGAWMGIGNNGIKIDGSPDSAPVSDKSDVFGNAPQNAVNNTFAKVIRAVLTACGQAGVSEQAAEPAYSNPYSETDAFPVKELQEVQEVVIVEKCHEEAEASPKSGREEGLVSPNRDLKDSNVIAFGNNSSDAAHVTCITDGCMNITGKELCIEETGQETNGYADEKDNYGTQHSSNSKNAAESCGASASATADLEYYCSEELGEHVYNNDFDNKFEHEEMMEGGVDVHHTAGMVSFSDCLLLTAKPLTVRLPVELQGKDTCSQIFYGNDSFYLLFRLHHMLYERMCNAKLHSSSPEDQRAILNDADPIDSYVRLKAALHSLLDGTSDNTEFEDDCQATIDAQSYFLFILYKLIHKLIKQLQTIVTEEMDNKLLFLFEYERSRSPEKFSDAVYQNNAFFLLPGDNLYRIECQLASPVCLSIQLMINEHEKPEVTSVPINQDFVFNLDDVLLSNPPERNENPGVFLKRNKRQCTTGDEIFDAHNSMEGLIICNGLESKLNCYTMKAGYILDSEDFMYRTRKRRKTLYHNFWSNGTSNGASNGGSSSNSHRVKQPRKFMFE